MSIQKRESSLKKTIYKILIVLFSFIFVSLLISGIIVKNKYFKHKLPTKAIKIEDIKSVQVINMDNAVERRNEYETMLKNNFGDSFLGKKIGEDIRLSASNGKQDVIFENLDTKEKITYNDILKRSNGTITPNSFDVFKRGIWKVYDKKYPDIFVYYTFYSASSLICLHTLERLHLKNIFTKFGITLSLLRAINNVSKQPKGTYGMIFEDDFLVDKSFYDKMNNILQNVPQDFDMLKLSIAQTYIYQNYKKPPFKKHIIKSFANSFRRYGYGDWILPSDKIFLLYLPLSYGNQAILVNPEGAKKVLEFYKNHTACLCGTDIELWNTLSILSNTKNYIYIKEMPVLLNIPSSKKSQIVTN